MDAFSITRVLRELVGQRCENVENPHGSVLSIDIGPMGTRTGEEGTKPHGWRHLTVLSPWRLETEDKVLTDWNMPGGTDNPDLAVAVSRLIGLTVLRVESAPPAWDLAITWSSGVTLRVFADSTSDREDAWFILGTDGEEVAGVPDKQRY
jgi:hypothetical protein